MNIKKTSVKVLSILLSVLMLFSAVYVGFTVFNNFSADAASPITYSAIQQFTQGTGVNTDGPWKFEITDNMAASGLFTASNTDFAAPKVESTDTDFNVSWDAFDGAANYKVNLYTVGAEYVLAEEKQTDTTACAFTGLTQGTTYLVQVVALNAEGAALAGSVATKVTIATPFDTTNIRLVNDMSDTSKLTSTFPNTATQTTNVGKNFAKEADVTGLKFDTGVNSITFDLLNNAGNIANVNLKSYEAVAFYIDAATPFSFQNLTTAAGKRFTNVLKDSSNPAANDSNIYFITEDGTFSNHNNCDWENGFFNINAGDKGYIIFKIGHSDLVKATDYVTNKITLNATQWHYGVAANRGKPYYIDNLMLVKDIEKFAADVAAQASAGGEEVVIASDPVLSADSFNANTLGNAGAGDAKYLLSYGNIGFRLTSSHGAKLTFTAPEDNFYEFNGNFFVKNNSVSATGTLKYKVTKTDLQGNQTVLWPTNADEKTIEVTAENKTPAADDLSFVRVALKQGETLSIDASMAFTSGSHIDVTLGAPVMIVTNDITENSKGKFAEYNWTAFAFKKSHKDNLAVSAADLVMNKSSVNIKGFVYDPETFNTTYGTETSYNPGWNHYIKFTTGVAIHSEGEALQMEAGVNHGVSLETFAPFTGKASAMFKGNGFTSIRVLVNGVKVYPQDSEWQAYSDVIKVAVDANEGDSIKFEIMRHAEGGTHPYLVVPDAPYTDTQLFRFMSGNTYNQASENSFAAQLERPYIDKAYKGDFEHAPTAVFNFAALDVVSGACLDADYYDDTNNNYLYNSIYDGAGFHFDKDERLLLEATGASGSLITEGTGGAIIFKVPATGMYDVTTGLKFADGSGKANFRVVYDDVVVWPADGSWFGTDGSSEVPAVLVAATAGKEIVLQYAVSENSGKVTLDLGAPTVYKLPSTIPAEKGYMDVFGPALYEPKAVNGKDVVVSAMGNRYKFFALDASYNQSELTNYNADNRVLQNADSSVALDFAAGEIAATLKANTGASFKVQVPLSGLSNIIFKPKGVVKVRALVNGEVVKDWTDTAIDGTLGVEIIETELNVNDIVELQIFSEIEQTVKLASPSVSVIGDHMVGNLESDQAFYPANDDPYKGSSYTGAYAQPLRIWNFNTFNAADPSTLEAVNFYDSTQERYLYNTNMLNAGYKFAQSGLKAVLTNDGTNFYGASVEFIAPEKFDADMLWSFIPEGDASVTGKLNVRIVLNDKVVWPTDAEWKTVDLTAGNALDFPLYELGLEKGDTVNVELYVSDTTSEAVTVNMKFPVIKFTGKARFLSPDAQADVYAIHNYNPYGESVYDGPHTPVESRWNFELLTYQATENDPSGALAESDTFAVKSVPNYKKSWNHYLMGNDNEGYHIVASSSQATGEIYNKIDTNAETGEKTYRSNGLSWRFVSPITGPAKLMGAPTPSKFVYEVKDDNDDVIGTEYTHYYYRIQLNGETIWPTDSEWAHMHNENKSSGFAGLDIDLNAGDEIVCQLFMKSFDQDGNIVATSSGIIQLGNTSVVLVDPESITSGKSRFNPSSDWTTQYQISPYWSYEISYDNTNYSWQPIANWFGEFGMWRDTTNGSVGIAKDYTWFMDGSDKHVALSRTLTIERDGYIQITEGKATFSAPTTEQAGAIIKIMCNDETWLTSTEFYKSAYAYEKINKAVKAGDKIRFVMTLTDGTGTGWSSYIRWTPTVSWSKRNFEATGSKNIFQGLNDTMLAYFQTLDSSVQFDLDYENNKYLAENPPMEEIISSSNIESTDEDTSSKNDNQTSSKRKKKTVTTYQIISGTPIWLIIVIIVAAVVVVGGLVTLLILKKKGIILAPKLDDADSGESAESVENTNSDTEEN